MILLIDNYDSFSYNLYQLLGELADGEEIRVLRNDAYTCKELEALSPSRILLSPGPGRPADAGVCEEAVRHFEGKVPILGVCLGHQAICEAYGAQIGYADRLMHGKSSVLEFTGESTLFRGVSERPQAARYHSLVALREGFPDALRVTSTSPEGEIMSVEHREYPTFGVQFHPESILTPEGKTIVRNFLKL